MVPKISPNIAAELNEKGELIGIEIFNDSAFIWNSILQLMRERMLQFSKFFAFNFHVKNIHCYSSTIVLFILINIFFLKNSPKYL